MNAADVMGFCLSIKDDLVVDHLLDSYQTLFIDLWGVVFDGRCMYPSAFEALKKIKSTGKEVVFLSNVPRLKTTVISMLQNFNISDNMYDHLIVSGELTNVWLLKHNTFGYKYFYIGSSESEEVISVLPIYKRVFDVRDADFIIIASIFGCYEQAMKTVQEVIDYKLPLICVNPDKTSINTKGDVSYCAGSIADYYEQLGGIVIRFGKPYKFIYEAALSNVYGKKILAIGDSMGTDIIGANSMSIDSVLICSGVHRHDLNIKVGDMPQKSVLNDFFEHHQLRATFACSLLCDLV